MVKAIEWCGDSVRIIDQTKLPLNESYIQTDDFRVLADAIRTLKVRGAPLIGIAAAYGVALAAVRHSGNDLPAFQQSMHAAVADLRATRPTAVNLSWALERMSKIIERATSVDEARSRLIEEALTIHRDDAEMCKRIGEHGASLVPQSASILTHCNTGALATGGEGTAQSIITTAVKQGKTVRVYADETRPLLQGARLTTWELLKLGIDVTLITDNMAASLMQQRKIDLVIVGADRIAANGDTANKIGTYNLAVLAKYHGVPFYVAAPTSTIDATIQSGDRIPIEERHAKEVTEGFGQRTAPEGIKVYSPAFDVTPAALIAAIITDQGIGRPPLDFRR